MEHSAVKERIVVPGEFYRHFKNKLYQIKGIAYHSETKEKLVVYQAMYGDYKWYVRPYDMFVSEVDHIKYPDAVQRYRFEKVEPASMNDMEGQSDEYMSEETVEPKGGDSEDVIINDVQENAADDGVNPDLITFLDADNYREKLNVLMAIRGRLNDRLVNDIATSMDVTVPDGSMDERFMSLKACIMAHAKYEESNRLR